MSRSGVLLGVAAAALALPSAARAQSESVVSADVSANAGYSNNPFSVQGSNTGSAVVSVDLAPRYQLRSARNTLTVSADANIQQYLSHYGNNNSVSGALDYQGRPSERITTHGRLDLSSVVLGSANNFFPLATGVDAAGFPITDVSTTGTLTSTSTTPSTTIPTIVPTASAAALAPITDVGLFGSRNRRKLGRASGDVDFTLSSRDSIDVSGYGEVSRYSGITAGDYEAYGGSLNYSRRLSSRLTVGVLGSASSFHYHVPGEDSQTYSVQATGSAKLSDRWSANGALGVSFVQGGIGASTHSTSLSGNLNLCRNGPLTSMCLSAARQVSPTGYAGTQYVTSAGLSWSKRIDERQNVSLNAAYTSVGGGDSPLVIGGLPYQSEYVQVSAGYSRRLGQRLSLSASVNYRELLGGNAGRPADFGGLIGLAYHFGDRR